MTKENNDVRCESPDTHKSFRLTVGHNLLELYDDVERGRLMGFTSQIGVIEHDPDGGRYAYRQPMAREWGYND